MERRNAVIAKAFDGIPAAHTASEAQTPVSDMKLEFLITAWSENPTPLSYEILVI
jgi:hypothetical protein